ncbi:MAG: DUF5916 domain-containing protein [Verrucomicrobia bacterium]|nr:DUF5916 domain-containing protein [Verrucomicrobiota bacterium]MDA1066267.1 DUF5916 domain-containing protein [Verrucomicrobiota bacterium]
MSINLLRIFICLCVFNRILLASDSPIPERQEIPPYRLDRDYRPEITAVRVETPPKIDGHLDEEVWQTAPLAGPLLQNQPQSYTHMDQQTFFRVAYDDHYLYFALWCWDTEPDKIVARYMRRDDTLWDDDSITVNLDTFNDERNAYSFIANPNGTRHDALATNNANYNSQWDGVWEAKTQITDYGWQTEMAFPLTTFSFDPEASQWGLNVVRRIKRLDQQGIWSSPRNSVRGYYMSEAGKLNGLSGLKQGLGLEINPYILGKQSDDKVLGTDDFDFEWGGDIRYRITPKMSATLSYNTDFAAAETDARQVNLTRFSLFFPEKRSFFLEDAGVFNYGGLAGRFSRRTGSRASPVILPFFSRRIGLNNSGEVVPLLGAAKLSGRIGDYNIGVINAVVDANGELNSQNAFVGRVKRQIFDQSSIGVLATHGDPNSEYNNLLLGGDFQYLTNQFLNKYRLEVNAFAMATDSDHPNFESGLAPVVGGSAILPAAEFEAEMAFAHVDENFHPALGFAPRTGVRRYYTRLLYKPYIESKEWLRQMYYSYEGEYITDLSNKLASSRHIFTPLQLLFESGDEIIFEMESSADVPNSQFPIYNVDGEADDVLIPAGDYSWTRGILAFQTSTRRKLQLNHDFSFGDFYNGTRIENTSELTYLPSKHFGAVLSYSKQDVELPTGDFDIKLTSLTALINFTPDFSWSNLVQYDNVSNTMGINSRLVWEYKPGKRVFLVLNQSYLDERTGFVRKQMDTTLKLSSIFRF